MYRLTIEAFVLDRKAESALRTAMKDISLFRSSIRIMPGGIQGACAHYATEKSPDLVLVQSRGGRDALAGALENLAEVLTTGTQVMVAADVDSIEFYRSLIDLGVGSYILSPITPRSFMRAVRDIFGSDRNSERGRVVAVVGSKGGCGSSTVAHNLAHSMAAIYGRPVSLLDLDLHFGTVGMDFNHEPRSGLRDALSQGARLDEALLERVFIKEGEHLWILASNPTLNDPELLTTENLEIVLEVVARMSSLIVLDVPHAWNGAMGGILSSADEVIVVSEPDLPGLRNTQMLFETLGPIRPHGTVMRCVINGHGLNSSTELGTKDFADTIGVAPSLVIPWDPVTFRAASSNGQMVSQIPGKAKYAKVFEELSKLVVGSRYTPAKKTRVKTPSLFQGLFRRKAKVEQPIPAEESRK